MSLLTPTNSLVNNLMANSKSPTPAVGMGATELQWTDRSPYTIVEVKSASRIVVQADSSKRIDGNGMSESQDYEYSPNPNGRKVVVTLRKNGRWVAEGQPAKNGTTFAIGYRDAYHDFSF